MITLLVIILIALDLLLAYLQLRGAARARKVKRQHRFWLALSIATLMAIAWLYGAAWGYGQGLEWYPDEVEPTTARRISL
jgi:hypothetical protein